jgi:hypothetical protein
METRLNHAVAPLPNTQSRPDMGAPKAAVRTEMAPPIAVTAQAGAEQSRWTRERKSDPGLAGRPRYENSVDLDRETGDLIYRVIDPTSRATIAQYPYEGLLKLRAYIKSATEKG